MSDPYTAPMRTAEGVVFGWLEAMFTHRRLVERVESRRGAVLAGYCASGCTAPVAVVEPEPLCEQCAREMQT